MTINIPAGSLVVLVGASSAGKSTFAHKHFRPTEIVSSDTCRALVADDENSQDATADAFAVLHFIAGKRLRAGRLTVADATNVKPESRRPLLALARRYGRPAVAVVFDLPLTVCLARNALRKDRSVPAEAVALHRDHLSRSLRSLNQEAFSAVYTLESEEAVEAATVERRPEVVRSQSGRSGELRQGSLPLD